MSFDTLQRLWSDPEGVIFVVRRVLVDYGARFWKLYAVSLVLGGLASGCTSMAAYLIAYVVNQAYENRSITGIVSLSAVVIAIFATKGFAQYGQAVILAHVGSQITADGQRRIFEKFLRENLGYFADRHSSEFMARATFAAGAPAGVLSTLVNTVGRDLFTLVGLTAVMIIQDPILSLATMLVVPPAVIFVRGLVQQARALAYAQFQSSSAILEVVQETVQGMRIVKAFNLENSMRRRVGDSITAVQRASNQMSFIANRTGPLMETLGGVAVALIIAYGGYRVVATGANPGEFFSFAAAFLLAYEPAKRLTQVNLSLNNSLVGLKVLFEVLDTPNTEPDDDDNPPLRLEKGRLEFTAVRFAYRAGEPVLRGISFVAEPGRITALVGPSGGGKSTIFSLILRFYDIENGVIRIDDQDIGAVTRQSLRGQIGYVGQDVFLFRGNIRENIAVGNPAADEAQIVAAAKAALAHDFIVSFPRGYETQVGELGSLLSAGQRQRIAVARALLKDAKLVLLDEPTSALDTGSERLVGDAIERLCQGRTILVIAHRLHTVVHADRIHFVEDGAIVETGTHAALLRKEGRYAELYRLQFRDQKAEASAGANVAVSIGG